MILGFLRLVLLAGLCLFCGCNFVILRESLHGFLICRFVRKFANFLISCLNTYANLAESALLKPTRAFFGSSLGFWRFGLKTCKIGRFWAFLGIYRGETEAILSQKLCSVTKLTGVE